MTETDTTHFDPPAEPSGDPASDQTSGTVMLYGRPTCAMTGPIRQVLERAGVPHTYVNILQDEAARERVRAINNGYESVPTLVFPDGSTLTEPSTAALTRKLSLLGYRVPLSARLAGYAWWLVIIAGLALAILRALGVF